MLCIVKDTSMGPKCNPNRVWPNDSINGQMLLFSLCIQFNIYLYIFLYVHSFRSAHSKNYQAPITGLIGQTYIKERTFRKRIWGNYETVEGHIRQKIYKK